MPHILGNLYLRHIYIYIYIYIYLKNDSGYCCWCATFNGS